jgi:3-deoxy-D-manno-octulosonic-acid transferase
MISTKKDSILYRLYNFLVWSFTPFIFLYLIIRLIKGKESSTRFRERLGFPNKNKVSHSKLIWIHVASLGEAISSFTLIENLAKESESFNFLISSGTINSAKMIETKFSTNTRIIHQFVPIDHQIAVQNFLNFWQPHFALWFESELWPNLLRFTARKCPILLLNARMSDRSFARWKVFRFCAPKIFEKFQHIYPQSQNDLRKYQELGASNLTFIGNIKYANDIKRENIENEILNIIKGKKVIVAASTHADEEEGIIGIYNTLRKIHNNLLLIIIPRHLSRVKEICSFIASSHNHYILRSSKNYDIKQIYIVDTLGELIKFYEIADIIFLGGSMVNIGGHNPLEAAKLGRAVLVGPHTHKCSDIINTLTALGALKTVSNWQELETEIEARLKQDTSSNLVLAEDLHKKGLNIIQSYIIEIKKCL